MFVYTIGCQVCVRALAWTWLTTVTTTNAHTHMDGTTNLQVYYRCRHAAHALHSLPSSGQDAVCWQGGAAAAVTNALEACGSQQYVCAPRTLLKHGHGLTTTTSPGSLQPCCSQSRMPEASTKPYRP